MFDFKDQNELGFTLVELAIVMIIVGLLIVGLLIGGVLKGQELITNAQVTSTVAQIKGIDAAASTFRDQYQALPGDMARAEERLPNCDGNPCENGDGNSILNIVAGVAGESQGKNIQFWLHMNNADLFSGVNGTTQASWGEGMPAADVGGGFGIAFNRTGALIGRTSIGNARGGHWLSLKSTATNLASTNPHLRASIAARIDRKLDDGAPNSGVVRAAGIVGSLTGACTDGVAISSLYNEAVDPIACGLYIRIQN